MSAPDPSTAPPGPRRGRRGRRWWIGLAVGAVAVLIAVAVVAVVRGSSDDRPPGVDSGPLRAELVPTPAGDGGTAAVGLSFTVHRDRGADVVLRTAARDSVAVGTGSSRRGPAAVAEPRAGRAAIGSVLATDVTTAGPNPVRLVVEVRPAVDGAAFVTVRAPDDAPVDHLSISFAATAGERFFGLGERGDAVDHRGSRVENRVVDGPWTEEQADIVEAVVPPAGFSTRPDGTYFPVPWVLSSRGYGVLVDRDEPSRFTFPAAGRPGDWTIEVDGSSLDLYVVGGAEPAAVLRAMTGIVERQPPVPAPFVLGPWWQASDDEEAELAALRRAGVPMSLVQTYTHYLPCGDQQGRRDQERARTGRLHAAGFAVTTYVNPMVCVGYRDVYDRGATAGAFTRDPAGAPYRYHYSTSSAFDVAQFDFSAAAGRDLFAFVLDQVLADGFDGWMEDFGEYTPDDAVSADGTPGPTMHNRYVEQYHGAAAEHAARAGRPLARFNRSGWTGAIRSSAIVWGGDPSTAWDEDGLRAAVRSGLGMGLSGVSTWGSDIGGFFSFPGQQLTPELLDRWIQFGAFSGVMRLQAGGISVGGGPRATVLDAEVLPVWRRYAELRTRLYPYVAGAAEEYRRTGLPVMRHHVLTDPDDAVAVGLDDQYRFGADLLVAPVLEPGATTRRLHLPAGRWVDLWRSVQAADDGELRLGAATVRRAGTATVEAPLDEIPVLVRAGAVIPLLPADVQTLADHGGGQVVRLADRADRRTLLAFPSGRWTGALGEGERLESTVTGRTWTLHLQARRSRTYELQASLALLDDSWRPCRVEVGGREVAHRFDPATRVLTARIAAPARASLTVRACPS